MDDTTRRHLETASAYQRLARSVLETFGADAAGRNWSVVIAFYASVHLVNGYLWEIARLEPRDHQERSDLVLRWPVLQPIQHEYARLRDSAYAARYRPAYRVSVRHARRYVYHSLPAIARVVNDALTSDS